MACKCKGKTNKYGNNSRANAADNDSIFYSQAAKDKAQFWLGLAAVVISLFALAKK